MTVEAPSCVRICHETEPLDGQSLLQGALAYARRGWAVVPLRRSGKTPMTLHGCTDATTDPATIRDWWHRWPDANVGIACGPSGLVVVDLDAGKDGLDTWRELRAQYGFDDSTVTSLTGGGGMHFFYLRPSGVDVRNSAGMLGPGVDIRARGGYVVVPPSMHPSGKPYIWEVSGHPDDRDPAPFPEELLPSVLGKARPQEPNQVCGLKQRIPEGRRNTALTSMAGIMRSRGFSTEAIHAAIRVENQTQCDPPLTNREMEGTIFRSLAKWNPGGLPEASAAAREHNEARVVAIQLSDVGNGRRLAQRYGRFIRYVTVKKKGYWIHWDGCRWAVSSRVELEAFAKRTVAHMYGEASRLQDREERRRLARHAIKSEYMGRIRAMIESAMSEPGIAVHVSELDQEPWLLNCQNGTVDLRTGELREHDPRDLLSMVTTTEYDPTASCSRWLQFLAEIMDAKDDLVSYLQRFTGYCLTGDTREDVFVIAYGSGCNGKTSFIETVRAVLGSDYARQAPAEMLLKKRPGTIPADVAKLRGARFVSASEIGQGRRLDEQVVKHLTGHDTITARHLYGEWFEFRPTHKIIVATNHRPIIRETSLAMWRRPHLVPFTVTIPQTVQDKDLLRKLQAEAAGILTWMVQGCLAWQRHGLAPPHEVRNATEHYRQEMDVLGGFLADCCVVERAARARAAQLYGRYRGWCDENGERAVSNRGFSSALLERGLQSGRDSQGRFYHGIRPKGREAD